MSDTTGFSHLVPVSSSTLQERINLFLKRWLHSICMQLLRVASTMSYQGSPYSGPGDEYDFEDDGYDDLDDFRDREETVPPPAPVLDSDEGLFTMLIYQHL